jgi:chemotaxis protein CheD
MGGVFANRKPYKITTILGSCVSVCLWDPVLKFGGINHYVLPYWNGNGLASTRYGNVAIENLIGKMCELGSKKQNLRAKVFGGSMLLNIGSESHFRIGHLNSRLAFSMLKDERIEVLSHNVGGGVGRKIVFYTDSGDVLMKYVKATIPELLTNTYPAQPE